MARQFGVKMVSKVPKATRVNHSKGFKDLKVIKGSKESLAPWVKILNRSVSLSVIGSLYNTDYCFLDQILNTGILKVTEIFS